MQHTVDSKSQFLSNNIKLKRPETISSWDHITGAVHMVAQQIQISLFQPVYSCKSYENLKKISASNL